LTSFVELDIASNEAYRRRHFNKPR
jgi:hypothetical protein